jgi:hypothetical protein
VLVALLGLAAWLLAEGRAPAPVSPAVAALRAQQGGDVDLYKAIVTRVRAGEGYYDAADAELRARDYPVRPAFNWRQPTYAWFLASLPSPLIANALLALIGLGIVLLTLQRMAATKVDARAIAITALMTLAVAGCFTSNFVYLQESWAGFFIALSLCLYASGRWRWGVVAGFAALAFRELAILPCVVALLLAARRRRWSEAAVWLAGLAVYVALMSWHFAEVARHIRPGDASRGWLAMGGASFLLETATWYPLFLLLPRWALALVFPLVVLGLAGDRALTRGALVVCGYLFVFAFAGNPFNDYWGAMYAPLLPFGLMAAPGSLRGLLQALRAPSA